MQETESTAGVKRERTVGNKVWIGLLGFCLFVCAVLDCLILCGLAIGWWPTPLRIALSMPWMLYATRTSYQALRRRLAISGSDGFLS